MEVKDKDCRVLKRTRNIEGQSRKIRSIFKKSDITQFRIIGQLVQDRLPIKV